MDDRFGSLRWRQTVLARLAVAAREGGVEPPRPDQQRPIFRRAMRRTSCVTASAMTSLCVRRAVVGTFLSPTNPNHRPQKRTRRRIARMMARGGVDMNALVVVCGNDLSERTLSSGSSTPMSTSRWTPQPRSAPVETSAVKAPKGLSPGREDMTTASHFTRSRQHRSGMADVRSAQPAQYGPLEEPQVFVAA